jgi:molecular chaperone DnaK
VPQVEVTFDIDANGIETDIERMVKDAEAHAVDDKKRKEMVEAKNHADSMIHATEKALTEHGAKVGENERRAIEDAIASLKEAVKGEDVEDIKAKTNTLAQASMKLGEAMYASQQGGGDAGGPDVPGGGDGTKKEDVVDAEFTEVDDDKKKSA